MPQSSIVAREAARLRYAVGRAIRYLDLGVDALTLGIFPDSYLDALTADHYRRLPRYHSDEHNRRGLFSWEQAMVERYFPRPGLVLITSAGAGREVLALLDRGDRVVATECVESLHAELAQRLAPALATAAARVLRAPPDHVPAALGPFDAAIIGWGAYTHLIGKARRRALLRSLGASLRPGAPLLLSYLPRFPAMARRDRTVARVANLLRASLGRRPVEAGETTLSGFAGRMFLPGEVAAEVRDAGFTVVCDNPEPYPHVLARRP